jgi:hypothetical protein
MQYCDCAGFKCAVEVISVEQRTNFDIFLVESSLFYLRPLVKKHYTFLTQQLDASVLIIRSYFTTGPDQL